MAATGKRWALADRGSAKSATAAFSALYPVNASAGCTKREWGEWQPVSVAGNTCPAARRQQPQHDIQLRSVYFRLHADIFCDLLPDAAGGKERAYSSGQSR